MVSDGGRGRTGQPGGRPDPAGEWHARRVDGILAPLAPTN